MKNIIVEEIKNEIITDVSNQEKSVLSECDTYNITDSIDYQIKADWLNRIKTKIKNLKEKKKKIIDPIKELFDPTIKKLELAEKSIKNSILKYNQNVERKRREEEAREREKNRLEAEKLNNKADELESNGQIEKAEVTRQKAIETEIAPTTAEIKPKPKANNVRLTTIYKYRVVNPKEVPPQFIRTIIDEAVLGAYVRATKAEREVPGVRVWKEQIVAAGSK